jgi:thiol:disulfide interchange protein DsbD
MLKKILFVWLFALSLLSGDFLEPDKAFIPTIKQQDGKIIFDLKLGKGIYIYDEQLKVIITKPKQVDITEELGIKDPINYDDFMIHYDMKIEVPLSLVEQKVGSGTFEIDFKFQGCSKEGLCYQPMSNSFKSEAKAAKKEQPKTNTEPKKSETVVNEADSITDTLKGGNIFLILATFFGFGLLLSLTPCIFPMIPILSSVIVASSKSGDTTQMSAKRGLWLSVIYVLSMSVAYTIAGVLAGMFGANLQTALQNPYVIIAFSGIFVALALSMFGLYAIEVPQSLQNKINQITNKESSNGITGVAIMGFLSALIVGPCVAPPLAGALVYIGQTGDALLGGAALFVMSLGMGIPLLAVGAGAGKFMPRPGGWMDAVSKAFGVVMLGIAIFMLERIIPPLYSMILWAFLFMGSSIYLLKFDTKVARFFTVLFFIIGFIITLGAGSGATSPLNPLEYIGQEKKQDGLKFQKITTVEQLDMIIKTSGKPIMLDFYADWCVSCKELEHTTFKDEKVKRALKGYILLQVDTTKNSDDDKALLKRFNLFGPPGIIFWDENGNESADKIIGYKDPAQFIEHLDRLK